jgi:hypothetical protein
MRAYYLLRIGLVLALAVGLAVKTYIDLGRTPPLTFAYHRTTGPGYIDQTLDISNPTTTGYVLVLKFVPMNAAGAQLPDVTVTTAFGSDRGAMLVPAGTKVYDILAFAGADAADVADVSVVVVHKTADAGAPVRPQLPTDQRIDADGEPTGESGTFAGVELTDPDTVPIRVGLVCIHWDQPPAGQSQQAISVTPVGIVWVPVGAPATMPVTGAAASGCDSLKGYFAPV